MVEMTHEEWVIKELSVEHERSGKTKLALADFVGVSPQAAGKWFKTGQIDKDNLPGVAAFYGKDPSWLLPERHITVADQGMGHTLVHKVGDSQPTYVNTTQGPTIKGKVPLISWVAAGNWSEVVDPYEPGVAEIWRKCPVKHGPNTFVLRVSGASMEPRFLDGDEIFVDPSVPATNGKFVVVRLDDEQEATFKQYIEEGGKQYLKALNPHWPEPIIQVNGKATICGVVIYKGSAV